MLRTPDAFQIDNIVEAVLSSANYKYISPDLVRVIAAQEIAKRCKQKEAIKATKNKLHQVGGAYLDGRDNYEEWLKTLHAVVGAGDNAEIQQACKHIMSHHASTRERLPILDQFYSTLLADFGPIHSILDLACGLNPLALPWIPLTKGSSYYAYDIYQHVMNFLAQWLLLLNIDGHADVCDLVQSCPEQQVDVALVLKTLPCLEQVDKQAGYRLLRSINAKHMLVSFPLQSLGGKSKGMAAYYEEHFMQLIAEETWHVRKIVFASELVFVVTK